MLPTNSNTQRIDVIVQLQKMIEMMSRSQGASIKEICNELECNERTFYRRKDDLLKMEIPLFCRGDPDAATSGKRWYIDKNYDQEPVTIFLTPAEKILLRKLIYKKSYSSEMEQKLCDKINKAVLHDISNQNFQILDNNFDTSEMIDSDKNLNLITNAMEQKYRLKISAYCTNGQLFGLEDTYHFSDKLFEPYTYLQKEDQLFVMGKIYGIYLKSMENLTKEEQQKKRNDGQYCCLYVNSIGKCEKLPEEKFKIPVEFDCEKISSELFTSFEQTEIEFSADQALIDSLLRQKWFNLMDVNYLYDRQVFKMKTSDLNQAKSLFLSFGSNIKILKPESFANEIKQELEFTKLQYEETENILPQWSHKNEIELPEDSELISFGKHKTNNALYRYYKTWWRSILSMDKEPLYSSIFKIYKSGPVAPMFIVDQIQEDHNKWLYSTAIPFEDRVFLEYPCNRTISNIDKELLSEIYKIVSENWWSDVEKCQLRYILNRNEKWQPFQELYKKNPPYILLTGVDYIDSEIAREITETGKLDGVPVAALLIKNYQNGNGTNTIASYLYANFDKF